MKKFNLIAIGLIALGTTCTLASCDGNKAEAETKDGEEVTEVTENGAASNADASTDSSWTTTPSGLKYKTITEGTGASPVATDNVTVQYEGKLPDGTIFDSSYLRGEPATFPLNAVIPGWTEGLQLMKEGGKTVFYIPSDLAYGPRGAGGLIPPNADLIFTVELIKVN